MALSSLTHHSHSPRFILCASGRRKHRRQGSAREVHRHTGGDDEGRQLSGVPARRRLWRRHCSARSGRTGNGTVNVEAGGRRTGGTPSKRVYTEQLHQQ